VYSLVVANVFTAVVALATGMSVRDLMMVYWIQSVVIGISYFVRILSLKHYSTELMTEDGQTREGPATSRRDAAVGFAIGYAFMHLFYLAFLVLVTEAERGASALLGLWLGALAFAVNHAFSLVHNIGRDSLGKPNILALQYIPYARVAPMHFMVMTGLFVESTTLSVAVFLFLKTLIDVASHSFEHHVIRTGQPLRGSAGY
jgi:hypothetical protein